MRGRRFIPTNPRAYPGSPFLSSQLIYGLLLATFLLYAYRGPFAPPPPSAALRASFMAAPASRSDTPAALRAELAAAAARFETSLDLSNRGLKSLPPEIGELTRLETLNLAGNELEDLPVEFAQLTSLRTLFFLGNRFTHIPAVVGALPGLFMLSFKSNLLASIDEAALPASLGWLILTDNKLTSLPASLGRLPRLRKLMLASNELSELPDVSGLRELELVRLSDNRLRAVPRGLFELPRLAWVALAGNYLPPLARDDVADALRAAPQGLQAKDLAVGVKLGEGASGTVFAAEGGGGGSSSFAVKVFKQASSDGRPMDEVSVMAQASACTLKRIHTRTRMLTLPPHHHTPSMYHFRLLPLPASPPTLASSTWWASPRPPRMARDPPSWLPYLSSARACKRWESLPPFPLLLATCTPPASCPLSPRRRPPQLRAP